MNYISTRDKLSIRTASQAILEGISPEGGLFVPEEIPRLSEEELSALCAKDYCARAEAVLQKYLTDFTADEIASCVRRAYTGGKFENDLPAPLSKLDEGTYLLELWHGPTCAFKDMALQLLPHLLAMSARKNGVKDRIDILVATSGDTGKAALEGFADAPGTGILVFYPVDGVSEMQKLQMRTQEGDNVFVCAIEGNFDDAQTGVKALFTDAALRERMARAHQRFSSANSINWGRLLPQIVYYVSAYCDLIQNEELALGDEIDVVVPTGNFGNILAAYYAKRMGVPIRKLVCASNRNNVLSDFMATGVYDRNRSFYPSVSPSMDILISSNLERLLFELCGRDTAKVRELMESLRTSGRYEITREMADALHQDFAGGYCDDRRTLEVIREVYERYSYLLDTHTAVACAVFDGYVKEREGDVPAVIVSTASPYKFSGSVCEALGIVPQGEDIFAPSDALLEKTGCPIPEPLRRLRGRKPRFDKVCRREEMLGALEEWLGL